MASCAARAHLSRAWPSWRLIPAGCLSGPGSGILSLYLPDSPELETHDLECADVDQAVRTAELVWNTAPGRAAVERHIAKGGGAPMLDWGIWKPTRWRKAASIPSAATA